MKRSLKPIALIIGAIAIIGMTFNLWAYTQLKGILVPEQTILPPVVDTLTIGILISFLFIGTFHLILLSHAVYFLPQMTKKYFLGAVFFCGLVLSGLYIASDAALLHDLGKEYLLWDVSMEWRMLFITSSLQLALMLTGFILLISNKGKAPFTVFPKAEKFDEGMFLIVTYVGLVSGLLGLLMLPLPQLMNVTDRFRDGYLTILTILSLLPFASSFIYWLVRNRGKKLQQLLDEKQFQDISFGGLLSIFFLIPTLIIGLILSMTQKIDLNNVAYSLMTIDLLVIIISSTVLIRSKN